MDILLLSVETLLLDRKLVLLLLDVLVVYVEDKEEEVVRKNLNLNKGCKKTNQKLAPLNLFVLLVLNWRHEYQIKQNHTSCNFNTIFQVLQFLIERLNKLQQHRRRFCTSWMLIWEEQNLTLKDVVKHHIDRFLDLMLW